MERGYRCPRCGTTDIQGRIETFITSDREADRWDPIRELTLGCTRCAHHESGRNDDDNYGSFLERWNDPNFAHPTPAEIEAKNRAHLAGMEAYERARTWPEEREVTDTNARRHRSLSRNRYGQLASAEYRKRGLEVPATRRGYEENHALLDRIAHHIDANEPRLEYAAWLRSLGTPKTTTFADFIEAQLDIAAAYRSDPRVDLAVFKNPRAFKTEFGPNDVAEDWWRVPATFWSSPPWTDRYEPFAHQGLMGDFTLMGGFIEHVAMKASRFLELADEVYSLMPIRHLTLTYCKGLKHDDNGLLRALLDSPHLERIRSLRFPARHVEGQYMELNRWTNADVALLAESKHLKNLRFLGFEDAGALSRSAYEALATSTELPLLSHVQHSRYNYGFAHYGMGKFTKQLDYPNILDAHTEALEDKYGYIPWCHYFEHYGTSTPDVEAVCEHPVALYPPRKTS